MLYSSFMTDNAAQSHPFIKTPNKTMLTLVIPVLLSLIAEPLTALVDTYFVSGLGESSLAALGVGTTVLSAMFWIFNFLSVGTQTQISQCYGKKEHHRAKEIGSLALILGFIFGIAVLLLCLPSIPFIVEIMGAKQEFVAQSQDYIFYRLFGAPAVLVFIAATGIMRGLQDMRSPFIIAVSINVLNIILDYLFIFGFAFIPAMGIKGAAIATTASQWLGVVWAVLIIHYKIGLTHVIQKQDVKKLLLIGRDMFIRTGLINIFLLLTTRAATAMGEGAGAAHQVIRQFWIFTALFLDAFAVASQSLVGYFFASSHNRLLKKIARISCFWCLGTGFVLALAMLLCQDLVIVQFKLSNVMPIFSSSWILSALCQPINSLAFATDGIHWGTGDFPYLRNVMITATLIGSIAVLLIDYNQPESLFYVWLVFGLWIIIRAGFGIIRIWPGIGKSPFRAMVF